MSHPESNQLRVFAGRGTKRFAQKLCDHLDIPLGRCATESFPDGELIVKIEEDVRGRDCYVVQSTCKPVNDSLMELLIFIDSLRRASAKRITAVIPYFGYARQDRKDEGRVPITAKLVANLITESGADRVLTLDLHAAQIQGFFDIPVDHLSAMPIFTEYLLGRQEELGEIVLVSPDIGNIKVANVYADLLNGDLAIIDKRRKSGDLVQAANIVGEVDGRTVLMFDDMISTAGTICEAAKLVMNRGARRVIAGATHGVLVGLAMERLAESPIDTVILSDSIPLGERCAPIQSKLVELTVTGLMGEAIRRIHLDQSVSVLFRKWHGGKR